MVKGNTNGEEAWGGGKGAPEVRTLAALAVGELVFLPNTPSLCALAQFGRRGGRPASFPAAQRPALVGCRSAEGRGAPNARAGPSEGAAGRLRPVTLLLCWGGSASRFEQRQQKINKNPASTRDRRGPR